MGLHCEIAFKIKPLLISMEESGDLVYIDDNANFLFFALIDGLGHGIYAHEAAKIAVEYLEDQDNYDLKDLLNELHEKLRGSRGIVISLCLLDKITGDLSFSGIGNITTKIIGKQNTHFLSLDGIVGYHKPTPRIFRAKLNSGDIMLMYSDGIKEHFDFSRTPNIKYNQANVIADYLIDNYSKRNDDSSIICVRVIE